MPISVNNSGLFDHRVGITAAETYPTEWVENDSGYDRARVSIVGATHVPDDAGTYRFTFRAYRRAEGDSPEHLGTTFTVDALARSAILSTEGTVTYEDDSILDDGQSLFGIVRPIAGSGSEAIVAAADDPDGAAIFGWAGADSIPPALQVKQSRFGDGDDGWVGGVTPDGATDYEVYRPNINSGVNYSGLAGADFALVLESVDLLDGSDDPVGTHAVSAVVGTGGADYVEGDVLTLVGGTGRAATFIVSAVDGSGAVTAVTVSDKGRYLTEPSNDAATTTNSDAGSGAELTVTYGATGAGEGLAGGNFVIDVGVGLY